jgi:hypothetical protein
MKILLYICTLALTLSAHSGKADLASCKKCHPIIYKEFQDSMHKRSTIYEDKVHKAVWDKHPAKAKGNYKCSKCHTPDVADVKGTHQGITCISCHTIIDVKEHTKANENIYTKEAKTFYSAQPGRESEKVVYKTTTTWYGNKTTVGSAYHDIDYRNKNYYNGNMCMGCHSHKQNAHNFSVCDTEDEGAKNTKTNCITCHMPQVGGSATTVRQSNTHAFHGFAGSIIKPEMLNKYVALDFEKSTDGFNISIKNAAPHNLMTHPLRVVQLRVNLIRGDKHTPLKTETFVKVIGKDNKPSMPWVATEVVKDTMIKANETRVVSYDTALKSGDKVEAILGYYIVNPKALKKLDLDGEKELHKFTVLKSKYFTVK